MRPSWKISLCLAIGWSLAQSARSCGPWLPNRLLDNGGKVILDAPEFYFELELKEIAREYTTPFKAVRPKASENEDSPPDDQNVLMDTSDFEEAIKSGYIKPGDAEKALEQHAAVRLFLDSPEAGQPTPELRTGNDEFALYQRGALAFHQNKPDEARTVWETLLALPKEQRLYRSTWAAFMLGKMQMTSDAAAAKKWFLRTRELAQEGMRDSLGLASASFGWEGQMALNTSAYEIAAPFYMQQLAGGDLTAIDSAKQLAGDVYPSDQLARFAADPLLRRITSAHVLCIPSQESTEDQQKSGTAWLAAVEKSGEAKIGEAALLGWLAYTSGEYEDAARWLKKSDLKSGLALWLQAKLDFRAGKIADAETAMAEAVRQLPPKETLESYDLNFEQILPPVAAAGDLGLLQVGRGEFIEAMRTFLQDSPSEGSGDHWQDASWLAERVLNTDELIEFVKALPWDTAQDDVAGTGENFQEGIPAGFENTFRLRWLLGRRLVRESKYDVARPYLPKTLRPVLDGYTAALQQGHSDKTAKTEQSAALWTAAQIARKQGMELMGTENDPDAFIWEGSFETTGVTSERLAGKYLEHDYSSDATTSRPLVIPASKDERKRLAAHSVKPEKRFHYRYLAANLAWEAAKLMPDHSEDTAQVLNTAGNWLKDRDDQAADRFVQAIERRCPDTATGKSVLKTHWFVPLPEAPQQ